METKPTRGDAGQADWSDAASIHLDLAAFFENHWPIAPDGEEKARVANLFLKVEKYVLQKVKDGLTAENKALKAASALTAENAVLRAAVAAENEACALLAEANDDWAVVGEFESPRCPGTDIAEVIRGRMKG